MGASIGSLPDLFDFGSRALELPHLRRAVGLHDCQRCRAKARIIDKRDLRRIGDKARQSHIRLVFPLLDVLAALRKARVNGLKAFLPAIVIDDLCRDLNGFFGIIELDVRQLARRDGAVHGAEISEARAVRGLFESVRPLLIVRLRAFVIANLAGFIGEFRSRNAAHEAFGLVDFREFEK